MFVLVCYFNSIGTETKLYNGKKKKINGTCWFKLYHNKKDRWDSGKPRWFPINV